jgi:hypothetical protein
MREGPGEGRGEKLRRLSIPDPALAAGATEAQAAGRRHHTVILNLFQAPWLGAGERD